MFLFLISLSLLPTIIWAQCLQSEVLVGVGYNLIYGNPDGSPNHAGRDPGLMRTNRILRVSYDEDKSTILNGVDTCVPDQTSFVPLSSCSYREETKIFAGTESYRRTFEGDISVSSEGSMLIIYTKFKIIITIIIKYFALIFLYTLGYGLSSYSFSLSAS